MARFIARRLLATIPVLFGLSLVLFAFVHFLPGDPVVAILGRHATPELVADIRGYLGLDRPLQAQYLEYLGQLLRGDLGTSIISQRPVLSEFSIRFPATIELTVAAMAYAIGFGVPLGRFAARHVHEPKDAAVTFVTVVGISIPSFVLGLTLAYVFGVLLHVLPTTGRIDARASLATVTNFMLVDTLLAGRLDLFVDALAHLVLPAVTLGSIPLAMIARVTRASVLEVSLEDHVRTARAKGLTERRVSSRHLMRNAWLPVITVIGLQVGFLLSGAVVVEMVFGWNGVGRWLVEAIKARDYFVIQSSILVLAFLFVLVNLVVDISYAFLDPRTADGTE